MRLTRKPITLTPLLKTATIIAIGALFLLAYWEKRYQKSLTEVHLPSTNQPTGSFTYVNKIAHYSFEYTSMEKVESAGGYEGPKEESDTIVIVDKVDSNIGLMEISIVTPPIRGYLKNEQETLKEIVGYWSGSTSQYLSPELNKVTGSIRTTINVKGPDSRSALAYRYEIVWRNDPRYGDGGSGTDVWLFIPITVDWRSDPARLEWLKEEKYVFLWLQYEKKDERRIQPILNSFTLHSDF